MLHPNLKPKLFGLASIALACSLAPAQTFTTIFSFSGANGGNPYAGLIEDSSGSLYGTTTVGGANNDGTVFKIDRSGSETVLHSFSGYSNSGFDGEFPAAGLVMDSTGNLYGTTQKGGANFIFGTVFKIDPSGAETVLHSFNGSSDGGYPIGGLVLDSAGNLYGTTEIGGASASQTGVVFKIDTSGNETVLHSFNGSDGAFPYATLVMDSDGTLYGTTYQGGADSAGTVFKLDSQGIETVLHSFTFSDGYRPAGGLIRDTAGDLFGTTFGGGANTYYGNVFKIDPSGIETALHTFDGSDGSNSSAGLVRDSAGNLYGTTQVGGANNEGTVFKFDPSGNETVLHSFNGSDGSSPYAGLLMDSAGNLYGTTAYGGTYGDGTVFKITFAVPFSSFSAKLDITPGPPPGFQLNGNFILGTGATALNLLTQPFNLTVGSYTLNLPAGSFQQVVKKGFYAYSGIVNGTSLQIRIAPASGGSYTVQVEAVGADLTSQSNPVPVSLTIGNSTGSIQVDAGF